MSPSPTAQAAGEGTFRRAGGSKVPWVDGPGWPDASGLALRLVESASAAPLDRYRLGDGYLEVRSGEPGFRDRLACLYRECVATGEPAGDLPRVDCTIQVSDCGQAGLATFEDAEPVELADFILEVFPDRGLREIASSAPGWRVIALGGAELGSVAVSGPRLLFRMSDSWRALVGSVAVSRLIRLQRGLLFFHAASVVLAGSSLLLVGPKGAGKTTLSLALAARGADFLGDEIAGVRLGSLEVVPLRRSLAIRTGPRAEAVSRALARTDAPVEIYPDGSERLRAQAGELFPGPRPVSAPLRALVFLEGFGKVSSVERLEPGRDQLRQLTPMGATLWGMAPARRAFDMLSILSRARCYRMVLGGPEESAACIERLLEE